MRAFMDKDFLLETETAKHLFHDIAEQQPLVDYHCHISPREIYEDRRFENLAQVWLGGRNPDGSYFNVVSAEGSDLQYILYGKDEQGKNAVQRGETTDSNKRYKSF